MQVLLSPAKTLTATLPHHPNLAHSMTVPVAAPHATDIAQALSTWTRSTTQRELKLSDALADRVYSWHQNWNINSPYAAGWTFQGDAFKSLDLSSWSLEDIHEAQRRLRIVHGVYGLLRPLDQFSPVRLEMAQTFSHNPGFKTLAAFWRAHLPQLLREDLVREKQTQILNLASAEYGDVALHGFDSSQVVVCQFLERKHGKDKSISAFAKAARGAMAKHVLKNRIHDPQLLEGFCDKGYVYDPEKSTATLKVFVRPLPS